MYGIYRALYGCNTCLVNVGTDRREMWPSYDGLFTASAMHPTQIPSRVFSLLFFFPAGLTFFWP